LLPKAFRNITIYFSLPVFVSRKFGQFVFLSPYKLPFVHPYIRGLVTPVYISINTHLHFPTSNKLFQLLTSYFLDTSLVAIESFVIKVCRNDLMFTYFTRFTVVHVQICQVDTIPDVIEHIMSSLQCSTHPQ